MPWDRYGCHAPIIHMQITKNRGAKWPKHLIYLIQNKYQLVPNKVGLWLTYETIWLLSS